MSPKRRRTNLLALVVLTLLFLIYGAYRAKGDDHMRHHPPQDMLLHEKFYSQWQRHDGKGSCCNNYDCYPTKAVFDDAIGLWRAERREDHKMIVIPKSVYDPDDPNRERESPDGQSHLCAPSPTSSARLRLRLFANPEEEEANLGFYLLLTPPDTVYCFTPGEGH